MPARVVFAEPANGIEVRKLPQEKNAKCQALREIISRSRPTHQTAQRRGWLQGMQSRFCFSGVQEQVVGGVTRPAHSQQVEKEKQ
jgi:hypothetical protein